MKDLGHFFVLVARRSIGLEHDVPQPEISMITVTSQSCDQVLWRDGLLVHVSEAL